MCLGLLKGRWRILKKALNMKSIKHTSRGIESFLYLHNLCIDMDYDNSIEISQYDQNDGEIEMLDYTKIAIHKRNAIANLLSST